jgi:ketosteroid isomerase-like protein
MDVARLFELIDAQDTDGLLDEFADDVVMELPFAPGRMPKQYEGKAAAASFMASVRDAFSAFSMTVDAVHQTADPRVVVVEHHADGVVASNGRPYDNRYVTFITFNDAGKVAHWREYYDAGVVVRAFRA